MSTIRYRKNINCLTSDELHDFREALAIMFDLPGEDENSYEKLAGLHYLPSPFYCKHGNPGFLTWHRAYMFAYEKALQNINCDIMLPFWDWSSGPTTGVPAACTDSTYVNRNGDTIANPLYSGPMPESVGGGSTSRRGDIDTTTFDDIATSAQSTLTSLTFSTFQTSLNGGPHGLVHVRVSGEMGSFPRAGYDPIFYLHHCNVDRLWAQWQLTHPGSLSTLEAALGLEPFNNTFDSGWKIGSDMESTDSLGYRYQSFCFRFIFLPPLDFWKHFKLLCDHFWCLRPVFPVRLVLQSKKMPSRSMELRVFVNDPDSSAKTQTTGNPNFAGSIGLFGMSGKNEKMMQMKSRPNERFDVSVDISKALIEHGSEDEEVTIKIVPVGLDGRAIDPVDANIDGLDILVE